MFEELVLTGTCRLELNTELRFLFASARVQGNELVKILLPTTAEEKENARINGCVIKVLRTLKKENVIQFYVNREGFLANSTEAIFLLNKYGDFISDSADDTAAIYVKI